MGETRRICGSLEPVEGPVRRRDAGGDIRSQGLCGVHQTDGPGERRTYGGVEERIVGATQDDGADAAFDERSRVLAGNGEGFF